MYAYSKKRRMWGILFVLPQFIGLILFSFIPIISAFGISFFTWDAMSPMVWTGTGNYISQFTNPDFRTALRNTLVYILYFLPPGIILPLIVALALKNIKGKLFYRILYFMPVVASSVSVGVIWTWLLNDNFGLVNQALNAVGLQGQRWLTDPSLVLRSIALVSVWWGLGFNLVIFLAGLQNVPTTYYEAARIDGANKIKMFFRVTLPMISPTILFVTIMTIIGSFQIFDQAMVMTGGGPARASYTFVYHIYTTAFLRFQMGGASASAMVLLVIILTVTLIQMVLSRKWVNYDQ